jgi:hypothetical protein
MGLDWLAGNKAKPGHEGRFRELLERIVAGEELDDAAVLEWKEIGVPSYATLGAPRVGIDESATAWFLKRLRQEHLKPGSLRGLVARLRRLGGITKKEREAIEEAHGYHVLELAPACDGLPFYTNAPISDQLELTSFRGAFLSDCQEVIGVELFESAYEPKLPEDLVAYGQALMERANAWVEAHGGEAVREQATPPDGEGSPEALAHIVFAAARWCIYWGQRGHWLDPWF